MSVGKHNEYSRVTIGVREIPFPPICIPASKVFRSSVAALAVPSPRNMFCPPHELTFTDKVIKPTHAYN